MPVTPADASSSRAESLDPTAVADVFLKAAPSLKMHRDVLIDLARIGWVGEFPISFYLEITGLLSRLPWLVDLWVGQEAIDAILSADVDFYDEWEKWRKTSAPRVRERTSLTQLEGLLLFSKLKAPNEISAQDQLIGILDTVDKQLVSDLGGTAKRKGRRHPLKMILNQDLGKPQTIEALAETLKTAADKAWDLYPMVSNFLRSTYLPLLCAQPWSWAPTQGQPRLLGVDEYPEASGTSPPPPIPFEIIRPGLRPFTADDLAGEIAVVLQSGNHSTVIESLSSFWRGEQTSDFLEAIYRLSHTLHWLRPSLSERLDLQALQAAGRALHGKHLLYAQKRVAKWRQRQAIEPQVPSLRPALLASSSQDRRWGILHLRGLLLLGRMHWSQSKSTKYEVALTRLIEDLMRGFVVDSDSGDSHTVSWKRHPMESILDQIGKPKTQKALASSLESLIPEISSIDASAGQLLKDVYLQLLKEEPVSEGLPDLSHIKDDSPTSGQDHKHRSKRRQKSTIRHVRLRLPTREKPLEGEPPEEAEPGENLYRRKGTNKKAVSVKEELRWIKQRIWGSNPLLVRDHIESLSDPEAKLVVGLIDASIEVALSAGRADEARIGVITALVLATGQNPKTFAEADSRLRQEDAKTRPRLSLREGILVLPVHRPECGFSAEASLGKNLLEPTAGFLKLPLPPTICRWINSLLKLDDTSWQWKHEELHDALTSYVAALEAEIGSGISLSRLRNFAQANIRDSTKDMAKTMVLCGSSLGRPETSLFYYNTTSLDLENSFRKAVWPVFGDHPTKAVFTVTNSERIGSQLLVKQAAVRGMTRTPSASLNAPSVHSNAGAVSSIHNTLTDHVLCMLMGAGGHRPTVALLGLKRFDYETYWSAAVFQDKKCDPAHFIRYAPIADLIAEQVDCYIQHLRTLAESLRANTEASKRISAALRGDAPLFFNLDGFGTPVELNFDRWRKTLPDNWKVLPLNWGRTWLASRGREAGIEADHLAIALGHLESVGYPYSSESPLEPAQLSSHMARPLGELARNAGWVVRKGLGGKSDPERTILEAGPLRHWKAERNDLASKVRLFQIEQRRALRSQVRSMREKGDQIALRELQAMLGLEIPTPSKLAKLALNSTSKAETNTKEQRIELSSEAVENLVVKVQDAAGLDQILMVSAHNALHRYLKAAQNKLGWSCPIPSPWLSPSNMEPTPFFSGMFRATVQIRALREAFGKIPSKPPTASGFNESEWAFGVAALALCVFSFESDHDHVRSILEGFKSASTSSSIEDLILVKTETRIGVCGIRGLAAVAVARLKNSHADESLPSVDRLNEVLVAMIPPTLVGTESGILARICATVSVANLVELSGLDRRVNDPKTGCVSMPIERQRQFIEEGMGFPEPTVPATTTPEEGLQEGRSRCAPSAMMKQYNTLRRILHIGDGPKKFALTGKSLSQANIGAFRLPLRRELEAFIAQSKLSPLVAYIASHALRLTHHGTPEKSEPAWSTVYSYITTFGADLVELGAKLNFQELDSDEFLDLYQDVIDRKTSDRVKELAARELDSFHAYLERFQGCEPFDFSELEGSFMLPEHRVDADLVQPQELLQGLRRMDSLAMPTSGLDDPDKVRFDRQATVFTYLVKASGGRHNEIAALRFKDVVAHLDSLIVFARPSRYRRLKTSAARRIIVCTDKLSRRERRFVSDWIEAEKSRLGNSWKSTLPIFSKKLEPEMRIPSALLRDATLDALSVSVGSRSKIHRFRHLVASEDLAEVWLSKNDWDQLRRARARVRRFVRPREYVPVVLPVHVRQKSIQLGHRRNSTTAMNYFHMPWMTRSRAYASLKRYENRHTASVVLGVKTVTADKLIQRSKSNQTGKVLADRASVWLKSVAGAPTQTPGAAVVIRHDGSSRLHSGSIRAQLLDRVLRDLQKGLSPVKAAMAHGLNAEQRDRLVEIAVAIKKKTGFPLIPSAGQKQQPRSARRFQSATIAEKILHLIDDGNEGEKDEVQSLSATYLIWASKARRDEIIWPKSDISRLVRLLIKLGIDPSCLRRNPSSDSSFEKLIVLRRANEKETINHLVAWTMIVVHVTMQMRNYGGLGEITSVEAQQSTTSGVA